MISGVTGLSVNIRIVYIPTFPTWIDSAKLRGLNLPSLKEGDSSSYADARILPGVPCTWFGAGSCGPSGEASRISGQHPRMPETSSGAKTPSQSRTLNAPTASACALYPQKVQEKACLSRFPNRRHFGHVFDVYAAGTKVTGTPAARALYATNRSSW